VLTTKTNKLHWGATVVLAMLRAIVRDVVRQHARQSMPLHRLYYRKNKKNKSDECTWRSEARRSASARLFLSASRRCSNSASSFAALAACVNANIKSNIQFNHHQLKYIKITCSSASLSAAPIWAVAACSAWHEQFTH